MINGFSWPAKIMASPFKAKTTTEKVNWFDRYIYYQVTILEELT